MTPCKQDRDVRAPLITSCRLPASSAGLLRCSRSASATSANWLPQFSSSVLLFSWQGGVTHPLAKVLTSPLQADWVTHRWQVIALHITPCRHPWSRKLSSWTAFQPLLRSSQAHIPKHQTVSVLHALLLLLFLLAGSMNLLFYQTLPNSGLPASHGSLQHSSAMLPQHGSKQGYDHSNHSSPFTSQPCAIL